MQKPNISQKAFWDVRFSGIDFKKKSMHGMEKVFNYGASQHIVLPRYLF
jgi:hypothetical protein